jgi:hypothetical protein
MVVSPKPASTLHMWKSPREAELQEEESHALFSRSAGDTCDNDYKVVARVCVHGAVRCDAEAQLICIDYGGHLGTTNDGRSAVQYVSDWWRFHMAQQKRGYRVAEPSTFI